MFKKPILYVALGDSLTVGIGSFFSSGFVKRYAKMTERFFRRKVLIRKIAKNGATTGDLLRALDNRLVQRAIRRADIITITIGGNDLIDADKIYSKLGEMRIFTDSLLIAKQNVASIIEKIAYIKSDNFNNSIIRIANLYNPKLENPMANYWIDNYNMFLYQLQNSNVLVANLYSVFFDRDEELLIFDDKHPNGKGYQVMAEAFYHLGYYPLY